MLGHYDKIRLTSHISCYSEGLSMDYNRIFFNRFGMHLPDNMMSIYINLSHILKRNRFEGIGLVSFLSVQLMGGVSYRYASIGITNIYRHFLSTWTFRLDGLAQVYMSRYLRGKQEMKYSCILGRLINAGHQPTVDGLALAMTCGTSAGVSKAQSLDEITRIYELSGLELPISLAWLIQGDASDVGLGVAVRETLKYEQIEHLSQVPVVAYSAYLENYSLEEIIRNLQLAAHGGVANAEYDWAKVLSEGCELVTQDRETARVFLKRAATQGHKEAMFYHRHREFPLPGWLPFG